MKQAVRDTMWMDGSDTQKDPSLIGDQVSEAGNVCIVYLFTLLLLSINSTVGP